MYKIIREKPVHYSEMPQVNPIRWETLYRKDDVFEATSSPFMCKDFLNDVVAYHNTKKEFSVYSFNNKIQINEEGLYLCVTGIHNPEQFKANIEQAINTILFKQLCGLVEVILNDNKNIILLLPKVLLKSTFYMSLVTMMIRCCNYGFVIEKWEDFFKKDSPLLQIEHSFTEQTISYVEKNGFNLPKDYSKYWFYCGKKYNSDKKEILEGVIHDNGCSSWIRCLTNEGVI